MSKEKASFKLFLCLFFIYTINVLGKTSFSAATVALVDDAILTKTEAGIISGVFWLLYVAGQFAGGFLTDKISPYLLIEITIVISTIANLTLGFSDSYVLMLIVWSIDGILQFGLWPSILKLVSTEIIPKQRMMPTIMLETYGASPSFTSLLSVGLLITNIFGVVLTTYVYHKVKCDELVTLRILYVAIVPMLLLLLNFRNMNIYIATILMSGVTILIYGSAQILLMNYPGRFHLWGLTATVGGIINCFAAFGNVIATYGSGFIADNWGWDAIIVFWNVLILLFVVITIAIIPIWKEFRRR